MLQIEGLTRRYGPKTAVDNVSIGIESGRFIGVIGRSGAGKSTLLRMVNRLETPTSGRIRFGEIEVTRLKGGMAGPLRHDLPAVQPGWAARRPDQCAGRAAEPRLDPAFGAPALVRKRPRPGAVRA